MKSDDAIRLLTEQISKLDTIGTGEDHDAYKAWHKHTQLLLKRILGDNSDEARELGLHDGKSAVIVAGNPTENARRNTEAYFRHVKSNHSLLSGIVDFLKSMEPNESQNKRVNEASDERRKMKIFYSWQSDLPQNHNYIMDCLNAAIKDVGNFEIETATRNTKGAVDIAVSILQKIDESDLFLADISIVNPTVADERKTPNPNVMYELGYAVKSKGHEPIILLANTTERSSEVWPFDIRNRRIILKEFNIENKKKLTQELKAILAAHEQTPEVSLSHPYIYMSGATHTRWADGDTMGFDIKNDEPEAYYLETVEIGGQTARAGRNIDPNTTTANVSISGLPVPPFDQEYENMTFVISRFGKKYQITQKISLGSRADGKFNFKGFDPRPLDIRPL
jgi:DNA-binding protein